jgi:hypothetical protein
MIVKVVYVLAIIALGLGFLVFLVAAFAQDGASGLMVLILGPIALLLYICLIRDVGVLLGDHSDESGHPLPPPLTGRSAEVFQGARDGRVHAPLHTWYTYSVSTSTGVRGTQVG